MSILSISIATTCYVVASISCLFKKDYVHAVIWAAYAVANLALMYNMKYG